MIDPEKDIAEKNDRENSDDRCNLKSEAGEEVDNSDNCDASVQDNKEEPEEKGEDNEGQEEAAGIQGQSALRQDDAEGGKTDENTPNEIESHRYASRYMPPYYTPCVNTNEQQEQKSGKSKKPWRAAIFISSLAIVTLLCILGVKVAKNIGISIGTSNMPLNQEQIQLIQNAPKLSITRNPDEKYAPLSIPEIVVKVGNSVVEITTSSIKYDYFYSQYVVEGAGSGVIVTQTDEAGYIVTNHHVVFSEKTAADNIQIRLTNGETYTAQILGGDSNLDLAILRIEKKSNENFTVAQWGDSDNLLVGQEIIAIGNPLGSLGGTVTNGIIGALDRKVKVDNNTMTLLQHNAAINPGNSGGPIFDMMGNLVGIVNAKNASTGIEGIGFAIPSNIAMSFFIRVMFKEPAIGIKVDYGIPRGTTKPVGVYVVSVNNNSFKKYDRITKINGQPITKLSEYYAYIDEFEAGNSFVITVDRDGKEINITVCIPELPAN